MAEVINVVALVKVKPEFIKDAEPLVRALAEASRKEPGVTRYEIYRVREKEGVYVFLYAARMDTGVVHIGKSNAGGNVFQNFLNQSRIGGWGIGKTKWHLAILPLAPGSGKGCFFLVLFFKRDYVESSSSVNDG